MEEPEEPTDDDCCHNGCNSCVFDIYQKQLELWKQNKQIRNTSNFRFDLLSKTHFKPFKLVLIKKLTRDTNQYTFMAQNENEMKPFGLLPLQAGQHLVTRLEIKSEKSFITRSYSYIPNEEKNINCEFNILIKFYKNGPMSQYFRTLKLEDLTYWRGPYGNFIYKENTYSHIMMICMGTGIAPMYAISKEIITNEQDETVVTLLYGCKNSSDIILRDKLNKFSEFWNFNCIYFLSQPFELNGKKHNETFVNGRISGDYLYNSIKSPNDFFLICGKDDFCDFIKKLLLGFGVASENIFVF